MAYATTRKGPDIFANIFGDHYRDRPLCTPPPQCIIHNNVSQHITPRQPQHKCLNSYGLLCKTTDTKPLLLQTQHNPWDRDDFIQSQIHQILHVPSLMIKRDFEWETSRLDPLLVYRLLRNDDLISTGNKLQNQQWTSKSQIVLLLQINYVGTQQQYPRRVPFSQDRSDPL